MACRECGTANQKGYSAEMAFASTGPGALEIAPVYMIAKPVVCLTCGFTELVVPKHTLQVLKDGGRPMKTRWLSGPATP